MPLARKKLVSLNATPYYHCVSRCVRRAFLCGKDTLTNQSFEHRRGWIEKRLLFLADVFAIDLCAYAVMSNHYHVVLHINKVQANKWTVDEVIQHWHQLFKGHSLSQRYLRGEALGKAEKEVLFNDIENWRERLCDISWFMRCSNEPIARDANKEDKATGRFWEGRFKSQALLDEQALMACMAYVDLNPVRANMATTPETSDHTSIKQRTNKAKDASTPNHPNQQIKNLHMFAGNPGKDMPEGLPFKLTDYLELVDWTGRIIREDKKGHISNNIPSILERLNIDTKHWQYLTTQFESDFKVFVGTAHNIRQVCHQLGQKWAHGISQSEMLFSSS